MTSLRAFTSAYGTSVQETPAFSRMRSFTSFSISATCCGVSGALLKSNVNLSGPTNDPFCDASLLATSCSAQCNRCVTVWCRWIASRRGLSTDNVTVALTAGASLPSTKCNQVLPDFCVLVTRQSCPPRLNSPASPTCPPISAYSGDLSRTTAVLSLTPTTSSTVAEVERVS